MLLLHDECPGLGFVRSHCSLCTV